jgi:hypothetical protein
MKLHRKSKKISSLHLIDATRFTIFLDPIFLPFHFDNQRIQMDFGILFPDFNLISFEPICFCDD